MKINEQTTKCLITEYSISDYSNINELKEWHKYLLELIVKIIDGRQFHLYINNYNNNSCLSNLDSFVARKYNDIKYGIVSSFNTSILSEVIEESEFYLGGIYLLIGDLSEGELKDFIHYINFQSKVGYAPPLECMKMDNDGESIFWVTSSN